MKNFFLFLFCMFTLYSFNAKAQSFSGGDGSVSNPYQITTKAQLLTVKNYASQNFILMNNIDFVGDPPYNASIIPTMSGTFNGAGHTISNIVLEGQNVSFFGTIAATSTVGNLHLRNINFTHNEYSGATARTQNQYHAPFANTNNGIIQNSSFQSSSSVGAYTNVSGFVLYNNGTIRNCYINSNVSTVSSYNVSGTWFAGRNATGVVINNSSTGVIENCYYVGAVNTGDYSTGGFVVTNAGTIKNSFSLATSVVSPEYGNAVHRFANSNSGTLTNNYARTEMTLNGTAISSSDASSIEAKDVNGSLLNQSAPYTAQGWDFTNVWIFENGSSLPTIRMTNISLPVTFGLLNAKIVNGQLMVNWSTASETNCDHYDIEISKDGKTFTKIATIKSKAADGNSSTTLQYDYTTSLGSMALGLSVFVFSLLFLNHKGTKEISSKDRKGAKTQRLFLAFSIALLAFSVQHLTSCNKHEIPLTQKNERVYVRIAQVDKDGTVQYSKIVEAVKE